MFGNASSPFGQKPSTPGSTGFNTTSFGSPGTSAFGSTQQTGFGQTNTQQTGFGQTTTQQTGFGQTATQPSGFGQSTTQQTPFGQTSNPQPSGFGQTSNTSFGQTTTAPNFSQTSSAPAFGQNTTPAFGATTSSTPSLGTTAPAFGASNSLSFGTNQQKPGFGTTTQPSLSFNTGTAVTQPAGFNFGTNTGQSSFGTATSSTTTSSFSLGTTTTQSSLGFSLTSTTSSSTAAGGLSFGTAKPGTSSFGSPVTTTQPSLSFGTSLTSKPATTTSSTGFSFGTGVAAPVSSSPQTATSNLSSGLSNYTGGCIGSAIGGKSMLTITGNTATPLYSTKAADLQAGRNQGQIPPKCQPTPPEILSLIESFKNNMKEQKHLCLEVSRASLKPISKISSDSDSIKKSVMKLERAVHKNKLLNTKLKEETVRALSDVEVVQKAMDYPGGFPCDNSIITDYFLQLANKFQQQVVALRVELESAEKSILCELNPVAFTPQELSTTMQRLYECFVALAGRFQFVHAQISKLKVQHLELRRKKLEDYTDIFNKKNTTQSTKPAETSPVDTTPLTGQRALNFLTSHVKQPGEAVTTSNISNSTFGSSVFSNPLNQSIQNNNFLSTTSPQQVMPGSKRGKR